jgi:hypothetical protein
MVLEGLNGRLSILNLSEVGVGIRRIGDEAPSGAKV